MFLFCSFLSAAVACITHIPHLLMMQGSFSFCSLHGGAAQVDHCLFVFFCCFQFFGSCAVQPIHCSFFMPHSALFFISAAIVSLLTDARFIVIFCHLHPLTHLLFWFSLTNWCKHHYCVFAIIALWPMIIDQCSPLLTKVDCCVFVICKLAWILLFHISLADFFPGWPMQIVCSCCCFLCLHPHFPISPQHIEILLLPFLPCAAVQVLLFFLLCGTANGTWVIRWKRRERFKKERRARGWKQEFLTTSQSVVIDIMVSMSYY